MKLMWSAASFGGRRDGVAANGAEGGFGVPVGVGDLPGVLDSDLGGAGEGRDAPAAGGWELRPDGKQAGQDRAAGWPGAGDRGLVLSDRVSEAPRPHGPQPGEEGGQSRRGLGGEGGGASRGHAVIDDIESQFIHISFRASL